MKSHAQIVLLLLAAAGAALVPVAACDSGLGGNKPFEGCDVTDQLGCTSDKVCEEVEGGDPACFLPVVLVGDVHDASTEAPIKDARLIAVDEAGLAISKAGSSAVDGSFHLQVPVKRDATGAPVSRVFRLRVEAEDYQVFPRVPLDTPTFDAKSGVAPDFELTDPAASIGLIHLTDTSLAGKVTGSILADDPRGTLVVIGPNTGMADLDGKYVVFNVKPGNLKVQAFKQGTNFDVGAGALEASSSTDVDLSANDQPTSAVTGTLAGATKPASVILVQEDTFDATTVRGESPPGLRVDGITGAFAITGVPNGKYVVLPGFEDDGLVRDPDTGIGGTPIAKVTVSGKDVALDTDLRVVAALDVVSPGANAIDTVAGTPKLVWEADPTADAYHVEVFTMLGAPVWETTGNFNQGGAKPATVDYAGDALEHGGLYQFRVTSVLMGAPLRATEDLRGLFTFQ